MNPSTFAEARDPTARPPVRHANRLLAALSARDFAVLEPHLEPVALPRGKVLFEPGADGATT